MRSKIRFFYFMAAFALLFSLTGCDGYDTEDINVVFTLSNGSGIETHMWVGDEKIGAGNKVAPGSSRVVTKSVSVTKESIKDKVTITVYVGRNGATLGYQDVKLNCLSKSVTAFYDGSYLSCTVHE